MRKFLKNSFADISVKDDSHIIDIFSAISGKKKIVVAENAVFTYLIVAKSSQLDLQIQLQGQGASCHVYALFLSDSSPMKAKILTHILHSSTKADVSIVSLLGDGADISVDADIDIKPGIKNVVAHLLEENIVFGKPISVVSLPALSVASHDIQASHGAKVEKINQDVLYYMQSKGLSQHDAQTLVIDGYVNAILSHFDIFDEKELSAITTFVCL